MAKNRKNRQAIAASQEQAAIATVEQASQEQASTDLVAVTTIDNGTETTVVKKIGGRKRILPAGHNGTIDSDMERTVQRNAKKVHLFKGQWTLGVSCMTQGTANPVPCIVARDGDYVYELHVQAYPTGLEAAYYVARAILVGLQPSGIFAFGRLGYWTDNKGLTAERAALLSWPESGNRKWRMMQRDFSGDEKSSQQKQWLTSVALMIEEKTGFNATDLPIVKVATATCEQYLKETCGLNVRYVRSHVDKRPEQKAPAVPVLADASDNGQLIPTS